MYLILFMDFNCLVQNYIFQNYILYNIYSHYKNVT